MIDVILKLQTFGQGSFFWKLGQPMVERGVEGRFAAKVALEVVLAVASKVVSKEAPNVGST